MKYILKRFDLDKGKWISAMNELSAECALFSSRDFSNSQLLWMSNGSGELNYEFFKVIQVLLSLSVNFGEF